MSNKLELDNMSFDSNFEYSIQVLPYSPKYYCKDDNELDSTNIVSCQICFNVIWDHVIMECPNEICNNTSDTNICSKCSDEILEKAIVDGIDLICPFCRTIILAKEEIQNDYLLDDNSEEPLWDIRVDNQENNNREEINYIIMSRTNTNKTIIYILCFSLSIAFIIYFFSVIVV